MKIKTSELIGPALDWAVAKCERLEIYQIWKNVINVTIERHFISYAPSTSWAQGGPIIEREDIAVWRSTTPEQGKWAAADDRWMSLDVESVEFLNLPDPWHGPTTLIAAMRCYVASKLGDEVDVPKELI